MHRTALARVLTALLATSPALLAAQSVGSAFTYQGELRAAGAPANAAYDFQFRLFNAATGGAPIGAVVSANAVSVSNGLFSLPLDFGPAQFAGDAQWLEISVRPAGGGAFETLSPRTAVTATPYALGAVAALANSVTGTSIVDGSVQFSDVNASQFQARVTGTCSANQGIQSIGANGTVVCGTFSGGTGTITGVAAGTGLTGGGTSGSVTLGIAAAGVGAAQVNADQVQRRVSGTCATGQYVRIVNQDGTVVCGTDAPAWGLSGNAGTTPGSNFIGTTDATLFELRANNRRVLQLIGIPVGGGSTGNLVGGSASNGVVSGARGATIAGGGVTSGADPNLATAGPNTVFDDYGAIGGGVSNVAGLATAAEPNNFFDAAFATVGGGLFNAARGLAATIGGGSENFAGGAPRFAAAHAVVSGGVRNAAIGAGSTVPGGAFNCAGGNNSFAAGSGAVVRPGQAPPPEATTCAVGAPTGTLGGDAGTFVWADQSPTGQPFTSTGANQFLVRAAGGMAINTNTPAAGASLTVNGATSLGGNVSVATSGTLSFGSQTRQMLNLWGPDVYGVGVQSDTLYFRTDALAADRGNFAWFSGGAHNDGVLNPGSGGNRVMALDGRGLLTLQNGTGNTIAGSGPTLRLAYADTSGPLAFQRWDISALRSEIQGTPGGNISPGALQFRSAFATAAIFEVNGNTRNQTGAWSTLSDARLKQGIRAIEAPLDTLLGLRGHWFEYRDAEAVAARPGPRMGFVAQQVEAVLPEWVDADANGLLSVTPIGFEALTVEAMRQLHDENATVDGEQADRIAALEAENAALRREGEALRARLDAIEARLGRLR